MIAVVIGFQFLAGLFVTHPGSCSQFMDIFLKPGMDFLLTDTANLCILVNHGNIPQVVQVTEHTDFAELGHTCQQGKADASVHGFQSPVKSLQGTAVFILQSFVADSLQHGLVVFINEDHHPASGLFAGTADNALETPGYTDFSGRGAIKSFPILYVLFQNIGQRFGSIIFLCVQIQMQYRIYGPVFFQLFQRQSLEKILLSQCVYFNCRQKQTLAETPRTAQEVVFVCVKQFIHLCRFVYIHITVVYQTFKILYSNRI